MRKWHEICAERGQKICEWHNLAYCGNPKAPRDAAAQSRMDQLMSEIRELDRQANQAYVEEHKDG